MRFSLRHIVLLFGISAVFISFYFFGRKHSQYELLLIIGLLLSAAGYMLVLWKDKKINKIIWTIVVVLFVLVEQLFEPNLIKASFKTYIDQNQKLLENVNAILLTKGDMNIASNFESYLSDQFSDSEKRTLNEFFKESRVAFIMKDTKGIFYCLSGFLDEHQGIYYFPSTDHVNQFPAKRIEGNWYY
ncbi:hypothetical protein [Flavisolibacter ginsengisoli]|jgi:hypothetical protein|uniref:Uncharacterized protein n=1 Tax=Flavisolibacter ginsengisoli DSM 18119 TaxID=1121884 RepID=A0A1M5FUZ9_9BACT|nr:hypothetical protein [Flavisolibacter ginsengisoli]SHF95370.1 hypothetical protein SAMN02745131_03946 [Flavisolibacter ginsengisoli DSM 18119]